MKFHDELPVILNLAQSHNDLILRLDASDWLFGLESYKDIVVEVRLIECKDAQKSYQKIKKYIGEFVWNYEFLVEEKVFNILLETHDNVEIECAGITEKRQDMTIDELLLRFQELAKKYQQESEDGLKGWGKYSRLSELLKREIGSEIKNWERKEKFFEQNNSEGTEKAKTIIKFCKRILNFISQIEEENA